MFVAQPSMPWLGQKGSNFFPSEQLTLHPSRIWVSTISGVLRFPAFENHHVSGSPSPCNLITTTVLNSTFGKIFENHKILPMAPSYVWLGPQLSQHLDTPQRQVTHDKNIDACQMVQPIEMLTGYSSTEEGEDAKLKMIFVSWPNFECIVLSNVGDIAYTPGKNKENSFKNAKWVGSK